jgi:glycosyltransferase involved in cell wall biosynthesis
VLEAAATGVPVIATRCTGASDAVIPGVTGLLVRTGDQNAICGAVLSLLRSIERRMRMSTAARAWVVENYSDNRVLGLAVAFYTNLLKRGAQQRPHLESMPTESVTGLPASL